MATTASPRNTPSSLRRSPPTVPKASPPPSSSIARGATARSAVSPRVAATATRRASLKGASPPILPANGQTREVLSASLKEETERKEQLLVQVQNKDHTIVALTEENGKLSSALNSAETRLSELYADQGRAEEEMAARIEVAEKLRTQVRELEKEKRDILRRYNEQTATFEAERQTFYDNEQHLKSRIQSLTQARRQAPLIPKAPSVISIAESVETEVEDEASEDTSSDAKHDMDDPEEPAEMTALRLELSTLSTSHASLQSTLMLLQTQLVDLKRVNHELQEENESYNILLREKTLSGQFDVMRMGGGSTPSETSEDDDSDSKDAESFSSGHTGRSVLEPVDELAEEHDLDPEFESQPREPELEDVSHGTRRHGRRRGSSVSHSSAPRGESLANLPITGPGLDLAAELGRAENKDILDGHVSLDAVDPKRRKGKKTTVSETSRKVSSSSEPGFMEPSTSINDLDQLRNEVKSLKDANKALSLYASKIIDRIISQEGFEHVLAVDYEKSPSTAGPAPTTFDQLRKSPKPPAPPPKKVRPQSVFSFSSVTNTISSPTPDRLTTFSSLNSPNTPSPPRPTVQTRARRSLSFDWKTFSVFGGDRKSDQASHPNLRPLTLKAVSPAITGARKLETYEDEEDRKERERLAATMKLMGIEKPAATASPQSSPILKSYSAPSNSSTTTEEVSAMATPLSSRFSFFRRTSSTTATSETSSLRSSMGQRTGMSTPNLTQEALEQAEAQNSIAALEARERQLSAEIAKGASGGFTEIVRRSGDRRSRKSGGSGSTVWSAGMDKEMDD